MRPSALTQEKQGSDLKVALNKSLSGKGVGHNRFENQKNVYTDIMLSPRKTEHVAAAFSVA